MAHISTVVFDLDGTLVRYKGVEFESSWGAIALAAGVQQESDRLLEEYLSQRGAYADWVRRDAELLEGVSVLSITKKVLPPPYAKGVREAVERLRPRYQMGILSSGVDLVADYVREELGLAFSVSNRLFISNGRFTGGSETIVDLWSKDEVMKQIAADRGIALSEICYIGDHLNDVPVMRIVGLPIAFNPKDTSLEEVCEHVTCRFSEIPQIIELFSS